MTTAPMEGQGSDALLQEVFEKVLLDLPQREGKRLISILLGLIWVDESEPVPHEGQDHNDFKSHVEAITWSPNDVLAGHETIAIIGEGLAVWYAQYKEEEDNG